MTYPFNQNDKEIKQVFKSNGVEIGLLKNERLVSLMEQAIKFNKGLNMNIKQNVFVATTLEEMIEVFKLRSKVYGEMNYDKEFPDTIEGLNFDEYDARSAILYTKRNGKISGTCRVIFDTQDKLPMDKNFSLEYLRKKGKQLVELSRLVIDPEQKGLAQEPKLLTVGAYNVTKENAMSTLVSVMVPGHFKLYDKFGGFFIESELNTYGSLEQPFLITSWEIDKISNFFKRAFLLR